MKSGVNNRIKEARKKRHYTQAQVAELMGLKCSTYSQMERNGSISVEKAIKLAKILDVDSNYIIYGEEKTNNKIDFSPIPKTVLSLNNNQTFFEQIKKGEDQIVLTIKEKNIIKNFRSLKESDKKEILALLQSKIK